MIAKLEMILRTTTQNKDQHKPYTQREQLHVQTTNNKQQSHNHRMDSTLGHLEEVVMVGGRGGAQI